MLLSIFAGVFESACEACLPACGVEPSGSAEPDEPKRISMASLRGSDPANAGESIGLGSVGSIISSESPNELSFRERSVKPMTKKRFSFISA